MKLVNPTPGPWQVESHAPLRDGQYFVEVATPHTPPDGGYPMLICTIQPIEIEQGRGPDAEQLANARLIATAPDLLDALQGLILEAENAGWGTDSPALNHARSVIAGVSERERDI